MAETLYRGGKGDYLEGGVRVPAMAWWPGVIAPGQTVGDIIHETDLFTTFARLAAATDYVPTDRIIDGVDQTALFLNGDTFSRRDYVFIYTGNVLAATVKGRYKRVWVGEQPGLSGAARERSFSFARHCICPRRATANASKRSRRPQKSSAALCSRRDLPPLLLVPLR
jgi:arylsulfatase A-like enzyme